MSGLRGTLRFRLAAGFAGIAVLTAVLVGAVLLPVLAAQSARSDQTYGAALAERAAKELASADWSSRVALEREAERIAAATLSNVRLIDRQGGVAAEAPAPAPAAGGSAQYLPGLGETGDASGVVEGTFAADVLPKSGPKLGTVELSGVPSYSRAALLAVARIWAVASLLAVLLAVLAGLVLADRMSRPLRVLGAATERMAAGDLAARTGIDGTDEVGRLAASFDEMAGQVEATVGSLRRFVADAAHEIGTPLTALQADVDLAGDLATDEAQRRYLARAAAQAARLEALRSGLLTLSRLEAGEGQDTTSGSGTGATATTAPATAPTTDLVAVAQQVVTLVASRADQADLDLIVDLPSSPLEVRGDRSRLTGALTNLVDNACKFTPSGGRITVGLRADGPIVRAWVEDTGIGIAPEELPELFGRFHRARNAQAYPGSGLGLAIVRTTVELYGGSVSVRSTPGVGSRFEVVLPRATEAVPGQSL